MLSKQNRRQSRPRFWHPSRPRWTAVRGGGPSPRPPRALTSSSMPTPSRTPSGTFRMSWWLPGSTTGVSPGNSTPGSRSDYRYLKFNYTAATLPSPESPSSLPSPFVHTQDSVLSTNAVNIFRALDERRKNPIYEGGIACENLSVSAAAADGERETPRRQRPTHAHCWWGVCIYTYNIPKRERPTDASGKGCRNRAEKYPKNSPHFYRFFCAVPVPVRPRFGPGKSLLDN